MRKPRLLGGTARGSAAVESIFAIVFILFLVLGVIEVAFALYGRNVLLSSAHEGARAAVEYGRSSTEAAAIAESTIERAAGSLVDELTVSVAVAEVAQVPTVRVRVQGIVEAFGPVPFRMPVDTTVSAVREGLPE